MVCIIMTVITIVTILDGILSAYFNIISGGKIYL